MKKATYSTLCAGTLACVGSLTAVACGNDEDTKPSRSSESKIESSAGGAQSASGLGSDSASSGPTGDDGTDPGETTFPEPMLPADLSPPERGPRECAGGEPGSRACECDSPAIGAAGSTQMVEVCDLGLSCVTVPGQAATCRRVCKDNFAIRNDVELEEFLLYDCDVVDGFLGVGVSKLGKSEFVRAVITKKLEGLLYVTEGLDWVNADTEAEVLEDLVAVEGNLDVYSTTSTDLSELSSLFYIGGELSIYDNEFLTSLSGLSSLVTVNGELNVNNNSQLAQCDVDAFDTAITSASCNECSGNMVDVCTP